MKNKDILIVLGIISFCLILIWLIYNGHGTPTSQDFSNFGGYLGGVLAPIIGFFTLWIVIKTNAKQLENSQRDLLVNEYQTRLKIASDKVYKLLDVQITTIRDSDKSKNHEDQIVLLSHLIGKKSIVNWAYPLLLEGRSEWVQESVTIFEQLIFSLQLIGDFSEKYRDAGGPKPIAASYILEFHDIVKNIDEVNSDGKAKFLLAYFEDKHSRNLSELN